jgi:predicted alpha/beta-hydrolase family hydrolase
MPGDRAAVVLPGAWYPTTAPLLWFARAVAEEHGFGVVEERGLLPEGADPFGWARESAERALAKAAGAETVVVIGKSLASSTADLVVDRGLPAIWLTPMLRNEHVIRALGHAEQPTLLVGGTADDHWQRDAIPDTAALEILELDGLDHALQLSGEVGRSLDALRQVTEAVGRFLVAL